MTEKSITATDKFLSTWNLAAEIINELMECWHQNKLGTYQSPVKEYESKICIQEQGYLNRDKVMWSW